MCFGTINRVLRLLGHTIYGKKIMDKGVTVNMSDKLTFQFNNKTLLGQLGGSMIEMPSVASSSTLRADHPNSQEAKKPKIRNCVTLLKSSRQRKLT